LIAQEGEARLLAYKDGGNGFLEIIRSRGGRKEKTFLLRNLKERVTSEFYGKNAS